MQNQNSPFGVVAVVALLLACFGIYQVSQKKSCECPPAPHVRPWDDRDQDRNPYPPSPKRPRRPDGDLGEVKTSENIVKRDM